MTGFEKKVFEFIDRWGLIKQGEKILVAVSGGKDSMALLHFLVSKKERLGCEICVANMDHGLRDDSGREEAVMIASFCEKHDVPFYHERRDVTQYHKNNRGLSLEEAARIVRYDFLFNAREKLGADKIALAHHLNDLVETMLMRIARGTGLKGVISMKPMNNSIIRPLLSVGVQEILDYVTINMIPYKEDPTNVLEVYDRNFIRMRIVPLFKELNASFEDAIYRFYMNIMESYNIIEEKVRSFISSLETETENGKVQRCFGELDIFLKEQDALVAEVVREIVMRLSEDGYPPSRERIEAFMKLLGKQDRRWTIEFKEDIKSSRLGKYIFFYRGDLFESMKDDVDEVIEKLPVRVSTRFGEIILNYEKGKLELKEKFDGKKVCPCTLKVLKFPLRFRRVKCEDRMIPFGSKKEKEVFKIIKESGMTGFITRIPVLENADGTILWVPGIRAAEQCRVSDSEDGYALFRFERR
ncbi:tRNA lysidine(34) synthetase TilS [Kosmotoga olearia]|uniref:tRNA(Ile)-lysidine synthase n=2 Tax=Kosmotoga TaxID=651456 RepID=C5CES7_KOSOT|nr:tRNA lysidine(34) synthetase TilS [Kosmotoga olearia]ACR80257.1 tRNA(Ile)-lysidine synthetase [Kosmotoga olearia TBF 19.5.1]MDI3523459.1 tRNA(Ile)-lysidine synthase [Kosmotoga sp.]MDK2952998.1 tRNA(Ile)-lysidine synthase [Kosmotoga sp.]OAA20196.1 hypothetical protein DU53_08615 [Kosmotoga sp. DU53]